ncbi:hypothetical protein ACJX0J_015900, partial [Zea mays]
ENRGFLPSMLRSRGSFIVYKRFQHHHHPKKGQQQRPNGREIFYTLLQPEYQPDQMLEYPNHHKGNNREVEQTADNMQRYIMNHLKLEIFLKPVYIFGKFWSRLCGIKGGKGMG